MTGPTPGLDVEALKRLARKDPADLTPGEAYDVVDQLPALLAALAELEGLRAEVALLPPSYQARPGFPRIAAILRAGREAEEVAGG